MQAKRQHGSPDQPDPRTAAQAEPSAHRQILSMDLVSALRSSRTFCLVDCETGGEWTIKLIDARSNFNPEGTRPYGINGPAGRADPAGPGIADIA